MGCSDGLDKFVEEPILLLSLEDKGAGEADMQRERCPQVTGQKRVKLPALVSELEAQGF